MNKFTVLIDQSHFQSFRYHSLGLRSHHTVSYISSSIIRKLKIKFLDLYTRINLNNDFKVLSVPKRSLGRMFRLDNMPRFVMTEKRQFRPKKGAIPANYMR